MIPPLIVSLKKEHRDMRKHNSNNERIKRRYLVFQEQARRQSVATVDAIAKSLCRFEEYTKWQDFKKFHFEHAIGFKKDLRAQTNSQTGNLLSKSTINSTLSHLKRFFEWLSQQSGYRSKVNYSDAEYFNLSEKEVRIASASRPRPFPTIEQVKHVLQKMPVESEIQRRDRALVAFILLTGARDSAAASLSLKHVDLAQNSVFQDARDVSTKASKTFTTYFFPVGEEILEIFTSWIYYLRQELMWGNNDPLFPSTKIALIDGQFAPSGLKREHWKTSSPIREVFRSAFASAGLPYFNPHSLRKTLVQLAEQRCRTPEEFKAWSQNLGHENVMTTFSSYGNVSDSRVSELLQAGTKRCNVQDESALREKLLQLLANTG